MANHFSSEEGRGKKGILRGIIVAVLATAFLMVIMAFVMVALDFNNTALSIIAVCILWIACFLGGLICSKANKKNGLQNGLIIGGVLGAVLVFVGILTNDAAIGIIAVVKIIACIIGGGAGGIVGVQTTAHKRMKGF